MAPRRILIINGALLLLLLPALIVADADANAVPSSSSEVDTNTLQIPNTSSNAAAPSSSSSAAGAELINGSSKTIKAGGGFYRGMSREFVAEHNKVRARYGAPPLAWDKTLAMYARRWANTVRRDCGDPRHSGGKYGESFFLGANGTAKDALFNWEKEEFVYDKATHGCTADHSFQDCGHFAIMVNPEFRWVGCGRALCLKGDYPDQFFITCNYNPTPP
ncbi:pathogenesis-related protein PRB1-3-like [Brachypodium distachyon]|uniref:SCP domain-containing protein n=1 Tax=Brachypodium distachyon TaxID=15368 RepID=A0A0Q3IVQ2_BRADI|nr:pathogenesis-related protein PRB1-3-like [Brachypodium distachyon]KQK04556.2 hypothetical protein BRADI_2g14256v3 [Brachypodium distachyon]|eukprot:XP_010230947.3 pathogenesis-related protein PRB1-3-like [Brachypodium distachyon]